MNTLTTFEQEATDLELHVSLCAERYKDLDSRLGSLEAKMDQIGAEIRNNKTEIVKILVATAGSIITAILALAVTILIKF
jgi:uncharacterized protein (DUF697 family)